MLAYLLQHDSIYRKFDLEVKEEPDGISVAGKKILTSLGDDPSQIPWEKYEIDLVIDATGAFNKKEDLKKHLRGSVKKVVLTAPANDDETPHLVLGVNDQEFDFKTCDVLSNCSCTTNCASPMFKIIDDGDQRRHLAPIKHHRNFFCSFRLAYFLPIRLQVYLSENKIYSIGV